MFKNLYFQYAESKVKFHNGFAYINRIFDSNFWDRYFDIAERITICFKMDTEPFSEKDLLTYHVVKDERISVVAIPNITESMQSYVSIANRKNTDKTITKALKECDGAVIRVPSMNGYSAIVYCKKHNIPFLLEVVGDPFASLSYHSRKGKILAFAEKKKMQYYVKNANYCLYVSKHFLQNIYPTKGRQIGCPDANIQYIDEKIIETRIEHIRNHSGTYCLGLIGSLDVDYRGHKELLDALKLLIENGYDCKVLFLGPGEKKRWIEYSENLGLSEKVIFSGVLPAGNEVFQWIDNIDILVMPAKVESLGRAIIEAMTRGCPVIGAINTAHCEQIGIDCLCDPFSPDSIFQKIGFLIDNPNYMEYCALENYHRSKKYQNNVSDIIRANFYERFMKMSEER